MLAKLTARIIIALATPRLINATAEALLNRLEDWAWKSPNKLDDEVLAHMRRLLDQCRQRNPQ